MSQQPPHSAKAEQAVIGALLVNSKIIPDVAEVLAAEDFYDKKNSIIYQAIVDLDVAGVTPDLVSVSDKLLKEKLLGSGGITYLAQLAGQVATTATVLQYAKIVRECSILRQLIDKSTRIASRAYDRDYEQIESFINEAEAEIFELSSKKASGGPVPVKDLMLNHLQDLENRKPGLTGIETPWQDLNFMTNGLQKSDLIVWAGRPSMGKTSSAVQLAANAALKGRKVAIFTLETKKERIIDKIIMQEAMVDGQRMRIGKFSDNDWEHISQVGSRLHKSGLYIDDSSNVTVLDIRSRCRRLKQKDGLDLVVVDYLGLVAPHKKAENRNLEIGFITKGLKELAKELDVPVVALAQLNRQVGNRKDKRPQLTDLRESGNIEQDADLVVFVHREEYYTPDTDKKGIAELIVAKQREGPTGVVEVAFMKEYTRFMNLSRAEAC